MNIHHKFVQFIPEVLEDNTIYISIEYCTATHKCICGCGNKVVTPISPTDWKLIFDGETVSLNPSIGNWNFPCKSHYWISKSIINWAPKWSKQEIDKGRDIDFKTKKIYYGKDLNPKSKSQEIPDKKASLWTKLKNFFSNDI